jgi:hypothetical protein
LNHSSGALLGRIHGLGISIPGLEVLVMTGHKFAIMSVVRRSLKGGVVMDRVDVNTGAPGEMRRADSNRALAGKLYGGNSNCDILLVVSHDLVAINQNLNVGFAGM